VWQFLQTVSTIHKTRASGISSIFLLGTGAEGRVLVSSVRRSRMEEVIEGLVMRVHL